MEQKQSSSFKEISDLKGKFLHKLSDDDVNRLINNKVTIQWVVDNIKQPDWCYYPDAVVQKIGCWSLTDLFNRRHKISYDFCKTCECHVECVRVEFGEESIKK